MSRSSSAARRAWIASAGMLVAAVIGSACSTAEGAQGDSGTPESDVAGETTIPTTTGAPEGAPLGGINGSALEHVYGPAVGLVLSRGCDGIGFGNGTGFAIGPRTLVTNWHVVAEDNYDDDSAIDPRPWIMTYNRRWVRGTVIGATPAPDIAVIQLDESEPDMRATVEWSDTDVSDDQHVAVLGYPSLESGEFNLAVGTSVEVDGQTYGIPSFRMERELSARTGPGNSGGPVMTADGKVAGVLTWAQRSWSTWYAQDVGVVREEVESMLADPGPVPTDCEADSPDRSPLGYTVRLGTFADSAEAAERFEVVDGVRDDATVISVASDEWVPFLLSDYPIVMMAGPFQDRATAEAAVEDYQAAVDAAGQVDTFSVGVMPTSAFPDPGSEPVEDTSCGDLSSSWVNVTGVTPADPLKLRAEPSTSAEILAELNEGEPLVLITDPPAEGDGLEWLHVQYDGDDGPLCGWVARNYTTTPGA